MDKSPKRCSVSSVWSEHKRKCVNQVTDLNDVVENMYLVFLVNPRTHGKWNHRFALIRHNRVLISAIRLPPPGSGSGARTSLYLTSDTLAPFKSELLYILSRPQFIRKKNKNKLTSFNSISDMNLKKPNSFRGGERLEMCRGGIPLRADSWCVATLPVGSPTRPEIRTSVEALIVLKAPQCNGGFLVFCYSILNYWHDLCMLLLCDTTLSLEEMLSAVDLPPGGGGRERLYEFKSWICKEEEIVLWFLFCFSGRTPWCDAGMRSSLCFCSNTHVTFLFLSHRFGRMLYLFMSRDALCQCPTPFLQSTTFVLTQKNSAWWVFLFLDFFFFFFFK